VYYDMRMPFIVYEIFLTMHQVDMGGRERGREKS
jgi:hypothetical protein